MVARRFQNGGAGTDDGECRKFGYSKALRLSISWKSIALFGAVTKIQRRGRQVIRARKRALSAAFLAWLPDRFAREQECHKALIPLASRLSSGHGRK